MKLLIITTIIFLAFFDASAQSKLSFGLSSSYLKNDRFISKSSSDIYKKYRNKNESSNSGFDVEVDIIYNFKTNYNFETGVGFVQKGYKINEEYIIDPCFSPVTCGYFYDLYYTISETNLPNKAFGVQFIAGNRFYQFGC